MLLYNHTIERTLRHTDLQKTNRIGSAWNYWTYRLATSLNLQCHTFKCQL